MQFLENHQLIHVIYIFLWYIDQVLECDGYNESNNEDKNYYKFFI